eukprot:351831-Chlamydomonas_euryale.AAC.7
MPPSPTPKHMLARTRMPASNVGFSIPFTSVVDDMNEYGSLTGQEKSMLALLRLAAPRPSATLCTTSRWSRPEDDSPDRNACASEPGPPMSS